MTVIVSLCFIVFYAGFGFYLIREKKPLKNFYLTGVIFTAGIAIIAAIEHNTLSMILWAINSAYNLYHYQRIKG